MVVALSLLLGCEPRAPAPLQTTRLDPVQSQRAISQLATFASRQNATAVMLSEELMLATTAFLDSPNEDTLRSLREIWRKAHESYLASQLGLFSQTEQQARLVFSLDAWPIQPGFLDSLPGYPHSGIINDTTINVDNATLRQQHGITDTEEVCLGFHSVEYLIFDRPLDDFVVPEAQDLSSQIIQRRRRLLAIVIGELRRDLVQMGDLITAQFLPGEEVSPNQRLFEFLTSTREYMQTAFRESNFLIDQSPGHSAFSHTSTASLRIELQALKQFTLDAVALGPTLRALNPITADNYESTIESALRLISNAGADEVERASLPLMLSALLHQLEEFEVAMQHQLPPE